MKQNIILIAVVSLFFAGCIEEIPVVVEQESSIPVTEILVVEATITDEFKQQEVLLSRGSSFANDSIVNYEQNASITVSDSQGNTYGFVESAPGIYVSQNVFAVQENVEYQLRIETQRGELFQSETVSPLGKSIIDNIYAERYISDNEVDGVGIFVDSSNPNGNFNDYRYVFEETYKIIAPEWTAFEFDIIRETTIQEDGVTLYPDVQLVPREQEEEVCYNTVPSSGIILAEGAALSNNQKTRNLVRFINSEDAIISHRYSILVKQLLQTPDAADFYRNLLQFSQNENVFSQVQPGFIEGNIFPIGNEDAAVIGFFDVASVTEQRLFFNYEDFFPGEELPPYFDDLNCDRLLAPWLGNPDRDGDVPPDVTCGQTLIELINLEEVEFLGSNSDPPGECQGPYRVVLRPCGDCTALGSNVVPEFWEE